MLQISSFFSLHNFHNYYRGTSGSHKLGNRELRDKSSCPPGPAGQSRLVILKKHLRSPRNAPSVTSQNSGSHGLRHLLSKLWTSHAYMDLNLHRLKYDSAETMKISRSRAPGNSKFLIASTASREGAPRRTLYRGASKSLQDQLCLQRRGCLP